MTNQDTIAAIATAPGQGGIGIIRISGSKSAGILRKLFEPRTKAPRPEEESHRLTYGVIRDGDEIVDECMAVLMKAPGSYTREDVAEIQIHGGSAVLQRALSLCLANGARIAEPGEFTRRAFLNGRIDLSQAEAVMSLIHARGEQERKAAIRQMEGGTAAYIRRAADELYRLQAGLAACIDYPEEISDDEGAGQLEAGLDSLIAYLEEVVNERSSELIHDGLKVALFGTPNAGKSSLLNALLKQEKAIVSDIPGTTRDTVEGEMMINGIRVFVTDTAGLRETRDPVEKLGVQRTRSAIRGADIGLLVIDASRDLSDEDRDCLRQIRPEDAVVLNKNDLPQVTTEETIHEIAEGVQCITLSAIDENSIEPLREYLSKKTAVADQLVLTQPRHLEAVKKAIESLREAKKTLLSMTPDMAATDLQAAQAALGEITGDRTDEKLLDEIFAGFCVGK